MELFGILVIAEEINESVTVEVSLLHTPIGFDGCPVIFVCIREDVLHSAAVSIPIIIVNGVAVVANGQYVG